MRMPLPGYRTRIRQALVGGLFLTAAMGLTSARAGEWSVDTPLDAAGARALLNRLGYGATPATLKQTTGTTTRRYLQRAIQDVSVLPREVSMRIARMPVGQELGPLWQRLGPGGSERKGMDEAPKQDVQREMNQYAAATVQARLLTMANSDNPGREALLSFWLNHFSIYAPKGPVKLLAWDYVAALDRALREDSFESLLRASFMHPAMQVYLDNAQSTAPDSRAAASAMAHRRQAGINENLARELLELHTLGVDAGYTQADVLALARIITGAGVYAPGMRARQLEHAGAVRKGLFLFDPRRHDYGEKTFLGEHFPAGASGLAEIDRALQLMARHPATARHISTKLARRFLADEPPAAVIDAMSAAWLRSGGRISATLLALLESPAFGASLAQPAKFKEPLDYLLSLGHAVCGDQPLNNPLLLAASATDMGQAPLMHTTPDGYGSSESDWLSPAAMAKRTRLAIGVAAGRVPLADSARGDEFQARPGRQELLKGRACSTDEQALTQLLGPPSEALRQQGAALGAAERVALRLASPEFMRR